MPGFIGVPELLLLGLLALVLFGPKRLPEMGRGLGKGMREFKESISGDHHHGAEIHEIDSATDLAHLETTHDEAMRDEEMVA
jgi:sec-independent protein translocase protein TatA